MNSDAGGGSSILPLALDLPQIDEPPLENLHDALGAAVRQSGAHHQQLGGHWKKSDGRDRLERGEHP